MKRETSSVTAPRFVLLGGFLGAGKTTCMTALAKWLMERGMRSGLITNDQADGLVDTALALAGAESGAAEAVRQVPHAVSSSHPRAGTLPGSNEGRPLTVLFFFDAWSRLPRKNPAAVLRVFKKAFPDGTGARLIIKAHHLSSADHYELHRLCGRKHWITIIDDFLPEQELNRLFLEADILLSLQRSEGFGLNLAKAQAYGIPVITTGYGGHLDFCEDTAFLVRYELEDVAKYKDPWYANGRWAVPDEASAVRLLRKVAAQVRGNSSALMQRRLKGQQIIDSRFSDRALKAVIGGRLGTFFPQLVSFEKTKLRAS